jgi:hypothetical protein
MRLFALAALSVGSSSCMLLADLGGLAGAKQDPAPTAQHATVAEAEAGGPEIDAAARLTDGGSSAQGPGPAQVADGAAPSNVLSYDGFEGIASCAPWAATSVATATISTTAYSGSSACQVCLYESGVASGIYREYPGTGAGTYRVTARVKRILASDVRIAMSFDVDGGRYRYYSGSYPLDTDEWIETTATKTVADDHRDLGVWIWFGTTYLAGDCILVDDVTVTRDP